jgi:hypothetical protein
LKLDRLMGQAFNLNTTTTNGTFTFFTILAAGAATFIVSIPTLAMMALYVVMALLTAFLVLVFRKMLIILLVILAPLAFIAWVLPGTDRYWKLWKDNFTKLLLMFPMIMGLIAAGKIFASITAGSTALLFSPHLAVTHLGPLPVLYISSVTGFANLLIIIAAYFAPYFLLPQTYKWGGTAMGAIAKGVQKGVEKGAEPAKEYLKWRQGLSPWKQSRAIRRAETERRAHHQYYENLTRDDTRGGINRARLYGVSSANVNRAIVRRATQHAESELDKARREEIQQATIQLTQRDLQQFHPEDHDAIRRAIIRGDEVKVHLSSERTIDDDGNRIPATHTFNGSEYESTHPQGLRAALDRGVVHGHWEEIQEHIIRVMKSGNQRDIAEVQDFLQQNAATIGPAMTHLLKGMGVASTSNPEDLVKMRGEEIETILGDLSTRARAGDKVAATQLKTFLRNYATAAGDTFRRGQLNQRGAAAVKAFVDGDSSGVIGEVNTSRSNYDGLKDTQIDAGVGADMAGADIDTANIINSSFNDDGSARPEPTPPPASSRPPAPPAPPSGGGTAWTPPGGSSTPI